MIAVTYLLCCGLFYAMFITSRLIPRTLELASVFNEAIAVMADKNLTDAEKEPLVRKAAITAAKRSSRLIVTLAVIVLVSMVPLALGSLLHLILVDAFWAFTIQPAVLVATLVGMTGVEMLRRRLKN
ncbi:hypothetical protein [Thalassovita aquimarina]|uniref:Uncharacterized protein n=1 Tax=Thalassovita aquimarina TaxID=2785917 RepID=A0ABS5HW01_9RHOB|nr:hypothetical protein [Thalassovita aquimarina]MBR9652743.1 hypothetical protein [Thalassovita aquimarina]